MERIAEAPPPDGAVEPGRKVAVKIWAVEVLKLFRRRVGWVQEVWDDIETMASHDATPGIEVRMRKNWREPRQAVSRIFVHDMGNLLPECKSPPNIGGLCML